MITASRRGMRFTPRSKPPANTIATANPPVIAAAVNKAVVAF